MARKGKVVIQKDLCKGCYLCIRACPLKLLVKDTEVNSTGTYSAKIADPDGKCIACGSCFEMCADVCIDVYEVSA
jgi:2-oxoglutarate ferredoxin oxidoreductase subunit delta